MLRLELKDTFDFENNESVFNVKSHWIKTNAQGIWPRWTCKKFCNLNNNNNKNYCVSRPKTFSSLQLEGDQKMAWLTWNSTGILNEISRVEWVNWWYLSNLKSTTSSKNNVFIYYIGVCLFLNKDPFLMSGLLCCFKDEEGRCFSDSLTELSVLQGGGGKYVHCHSDIYSCFQKPCSLTQITVT